MLIKLLEDFSITLRFHLLSFVGLCSELYGRGMIWKREGGGKIEERIGKLDLEDYM